MMRATDPKLDARHIDGVICFGGEDWWYHNRGHYDMQLMRQFAARVPVLYINSIGMRNPDVREGRVFLQRVARKLKSFRQGLTRVADRFHVFSPLTFPKLRSTALGRGTLLAQVKRAARQVGIHQPLVWVACPTAAEITPSIPNQGLVYQRTDRFEDFPGVDRALIERCDRQLKAQADVTLFCSSLLMKDEAVGCRRPLFVDHGVDYGRFAAAGLADQVPADMASIPRPRIGFVGGIDAHTFDPALFVDVASRMPECRFILVGSCSLPEGWCPLPNVHFLGQKPYERVADYMAGCDVLIMPWNNSEWIQACNPVKLKEYLAVGRPVVSTPFYELVRYRDVVAIATTADEFVESIRQCLREPANPGVLRRHVHQDTWQIKFEAVAGALRLYDLLPSAIDQGEPDAITADRLRRNRDTSDAGIDSHGDAAAPDAVRSPGLRISDPSAEISSAAATGDSAGPFKS